MNTFRYKIEYLDQVIDLLKNTPNPIHLSSNIFIKIGNQFANEPNNEKLNKLLKKTYTVMAIEDEKLIGLASIDKEGTIGIFAINNNVTAQKLLLNALERRAAKTEIPHLFVQPFENARDIFIKHGYEELNEGDNFNLIKIIASKNILDLKPENTKNYTLDPSKAIIVEGKHSVFPFFLFGISSFFVFLLVILTITEYKNSFAENDTNYIVIFIVVTLLFIASTALLIAYFIRQAKLKKKVLNMRITNGLITSLTTLKTFDPDDTHFKQPTGSAEYTRVFITYIYYDEYKVKHEEKYTHRYRFSGPYFYEGQKLVIAYSQEKSYILNKYTIVNPYDEEETLEEYSFPETINTEKLSNYVPIQATKLYYGYALSYLFAFVFLLAFFAIFGIITANYTGHNMLNEILHSLLLGLPFFIVFIVLTVYTISIPLIAKHKYKKLLLSSDVKCTKGKIVHADKMFKNDNKMRFYCKFNDGIKKRTIIVPYRSSSNLVRSSKTSVLVVYNSSTAIVLVKKGIYPDIFSFGYYRD